MSNQKLLIKNGHIIDPANHIDEKTNILIKNGKIQQIGSFDTPSDIPQIDAKGKIVCPGFIDIHVHVREPGREDQETIKTISEAAAAGGYTTLIAMPNSDPPADDQTVIEYLLSKAQKESPINILACGCITRGLQGKQIADIWELKQSGAVVVSDDGFDIDNAQLYRKALQYCKTHNIPVLSHTEDQSHHRQGQMHEGKISSQLGIAGIPASVEDIATAKIIALVEEINHHVHLTHVSTKGSVEMIRQAKKKGLPITADTTIHHLVLTDKALLGYNTYAKIAPPLRSLDHQQALIQGLQDNTLDCIITDHAPHLWVDKEKPFDEAPFGLVGLETSLPLIITHLVKTKILTLPQAIAKLTSQPAKTLRLSQGTLQPGQPADITIFDPQATQTIDITKFYSKGQNSPYHDHNLHGQITHTISQGKTIYGHHPKS